MRPRYDDPERVSKLPVEAFRVLVTDAVAVAIDPTMVCGNRRADRRCAERRRAIPVAVGMIPIAVAIGMVTVAIAVATAIAIATSITVAAAISIIAVVANTAAVYAAIVNLIELT